MEKASDADLEAVLDMDLVRSLVDALPLEDREMLFEQWVSEVRLQIAGLEDAVGDPSRLAFAIHKLKGVTASLGALRLAVLAANLAQNASPQAVADLQEPFLQTVDHLGRALLKA